jgi:threonine dehydratase
VALEELAPHAGLWTAEPEAHDDHRRSLASGRRQRNDPGVPVTICDALLAPMPGELTYAINESRLRGALAVSDDEVRRAMAFAARTLKLVVEPSGAVALACVMSGKLETRDRTVAVTLSGGNVDDAVLANVLAG